MENNHTVNKARGIPDFAYVSFDRAYHLAETLLKIGGSGTMKDLCEIFGLKYKTGWLGLEIKSVRVWGLISGKGKMNLTERFYNITESIDPNEKLLIKRKAFLEIPLFKLIFDTYSKSGLPHKKELRKILESDYKISQRYSSYVANVIIESISKYFKEYGINLTKTEQSPYTLILKKEVETKLSDFDRKKSIMNIKITSTKGSFNLDVVNKDGIGIAQKLIKDLWEGESDTDENQDEGASKT